MRTVVAPSRSSTDFASIDSLIRLAAAARRTMQMNPYLSFKGDCEAAFLFYERCFGGERGTIFRYAGTPLADQDHPRFGL
jgi:hypothetical protein